MTIAMNVTLSTTAEGNPRPQLEMRLQDPDGDERVLLAAMYETAAKAVRATPTQERWKIATLMWTPYRGAVIVELGRSSDREIDAAMNVLRGIAG